MKAFLDSIGIDAPGRRFIDLNLNALKREANPQDREHFSNSLINFISNYFAGNTLAEEACNAIRVIAQNPPDLYHPPEVQLTNSGASSLSSGSLAAIAEDAVEVGFPAVELPPVLPKESGSPSGTTIESRNPSLALNSKKDGSVSGDRMSPSRSVASNENENRLVGSHNDPDVSHNAYEEDETLRRDAF